MRLDERLAVTIALALLAPLSEAAGAVILGSTDTLNGSAVSSFADVNGSNQLNSVGFQLSGSAVRNPGSQGAALFFNLPAEAAGTDFTAMELDWNPMGHPPPGIYDVPHFDFHFYYIPDAVRQTIPGGVVSDPGAQYRPAGYAPPAPAVPKMGEHSVDLTSPEFNGGKFTQTFIYGFYNNQEAFLEPMATQAYLESLAASGSSAQGFPIRQPSQYALPALPALVPTSVEYSYDAANDVYAVSLTHFATPTETPEPGTLALVLIAFVMLLFGRGRTRLRRGAYDRTPSERFTP